MLLKRAAGTPNPAHLFNKVVQRTDPVMAQSSLALESMFISYILFIYFLLWTKRAPSCLTSYVLQNIFF